MAKELVPLKIQPGFADGTDYEVGPRWIRGNLVRWHEQRLKPWKPWRYLITETLSGQCRGMHFWQTNNGERFLAIATPSQIIVIQIRTNKVFDITPASGLNTSPTFNLGSGYGAGYYDGSYSYGQSPGSTQSQFIFSDHARWSIDNWGDLLLLCKEGDSQIWSYNALSPYDTSAAQTDTTADLTSGSNIITTDDTTKYSLNAQVAGTGIPAGTIVSSIDANAGEITLDQAATQTLTNNTLTISPVKKLEVITTNADPIRARSIVVTAERYLLLIGANGDSRQLLWSAQEDYQDFDVSSLTSESGSLQVQTKGFLMCGKKVRAGILIFSSVDVSLLSYVGSPFFYGIETLATACGPVSSASIQQVAETTVWLSADGFWRFDGNVSSLPCSILESFLSDIDIQNSTLVSGGEIREFGEVVWFYKSKSNTENRCDKYILWGTRNNTWSMGSLARDAYLAEEAFTFPVAVGPDDSGNTRVYAHEVERSDALDSTVECFAETGAFQIGAGDRLTRVSRVWHDLERQGTAAGFPQFTFFLSPSADSAETSKGPFSPVATGKIDVRFQGRQLRVKLSAPIANEWSLGQQRLEIQPGGTR